MIRKCKSTFFLMIFSITWLMGQQESNRFSFSGSEIVIDFLPENDIFYSHTIDKDVTIHNLAETFQVPKEYLFKLNKLDPKKPVSFGKIVIVPLMKQKIFYKTDYKQKYYTLKYKVKKGDTFFKIQKLCEVNKESLLEINSKKTTALQLNEVITIGYYPKNHTLKTKQPVNTQPTSADKNDEKKDDVIITKFYLSDVIGSFDKNNSSSDQYFVLHNVARQGSTMDIYNPMMKKHVKAKVIGKIPEGTYSEDIMIIINKSAAKELNILDTRFKVNIKYEQ
jgi:LysM repeat protein